MPAFFARIANDRKPQSYLAGSTGGRSHRARSFAADAGSGGLLLLLLARDRFGVLARGPLQQDGVENASRGLLAHLSLLFVPAGVGVMQKLDVVAEHGIAIAAVLAISVVLTLLVTPPDGGRSAR